MWLLIKKERGGLKISRVQSDPCKPGNCKLLEKFQGNSEFYQIVVNSEKLGEFYSPDTLRE